MGEDFTHLRKLQTEEINQSRKQASNDHPIDFVHITANRSLKFDEMFLIVIWKISLDQVMRGGNQSTIFNVDYEGKTHAHRYDFEYARTVPF
jgi:hypothetical protein